MFCALERFDSAQFLSHAARTHTLPFPRTHSNKTHKHTSTLWTPSFSPPPPLVYLSLKPVYDQSALSRLLSVNLLIRSTGSSGNVQTLLSSQLAEQVTQHHCVPPWPWNPNRLPHRRHKPSLPAQQARTPSLHRTWSGCRCQALLQTPRQYVVGVKKMEWNSTFQKSQSISTLQFTLTVILNTLKMLFEYFSR